MKQLEIDKRNRLIRYAKEFGVKIFVETGTYKGDTVKAMLVSKLFSRIYTVDVYEDRVMNSRRRFESFPNIYCLQGDSADVMPQILTDIVDEPTLFWLDAHHSGKQIARKRGLVSTPIVAELTAVLQHNADHIVLIDDARYYEEFSTKYENYPSTEELRALVAQYRPDWQFIVKDDVIRTHK